MKAIEVGLYHAVVASRLERDVALRENLCDGMAAGFGAYSDGVGIDVIISTNPWVEQRQRTEGGHGLADSASPGHRRK